MPIWIATGMRALLAHLLCWDAATAQDRIINQVPVGPNYTVNFPFHVNIYWDGPGENDSFCGGVLISERQNALYIYFLKKPQKVGKISLCSAVLTACHCVIDKRDCKNLVRTL